MWWLLDVIFLMSSVAHLWWNFLPIVLICCKHLEMFIHIASCLPKNSCILFYYLFKPIDKNWWNQWGVMAIWHYYSWWRWWFDTLWMIMVIIMLASSCEVFSLQSHWYVSSCRSKVFVTTEKLITCLKPKNIRR